MNKNTVESFTNAYREPRVMLLTFDRLIDFLTRYLPYAEKAGIGKSKTKHTKWINYAYWSHFLLKSVNDKAFMQEKGLTILREEGLKVAQTFLDSVAIQAGKAYVNLGDCTARRIYVRYREHNFERVQLFQDVTSFTPKVTFYVPSNEIADTFCEIYGSTPDGFFDQSAASAVTSCVHTLYSRGLLNFFKHHDPKHYERAMTLLLAHSFGGVRVSLVRDLSSANPAIRDECAGWWMDFQDLPHSDQYRKEMELTGVQSVKWSDLSSYMINKYLGKKKSVFDSIVPERKELPALLKPRSAGDKKVFKIRIEYMDGTVEEVNA